MKIQIISGFLGAGKTTFINNYIKENKEKIVILENEFGKIGIDKKLIKGEIPVKEINSGCICCSLTHNFIDGIKEIIEKYEPNKIIIEPSGVAKLSDILKICNFFNKEYGVKVEDKVVIVDVSSFDDFIEFFGPFYVDQIENANLILFSNINKIEKEKIEKIILEIEKLNSKCIIYSEDWRNLNSESIEILMEEAREKGDNVTKNYYFNNTHNKIIHFKSISLENIKIFEYDDIVKLEEKIYSGYFGKVVRSKGIIPVKIGKNIEYYKFDSNMSSFNYEKINLENLYDYEEEDKKGKVVLIGIDVNEENVNKFFIKNNIF